MKIILDSNILISAIIKDSKTREIIVYSGYNFLMPQIVFDEIKKHESLLIEKSGLSKSEIWKLINLLCKYIEFIETETLRPYIYDSLRIIGETDEEDCIFIASAIALSCPIWSNDKHFKVQNKIKIYTTSEILKTLE